ncbi:MAG: pyridoxal-phosphate dependent enzyme [Deltaproteobacteria bacterium]|nr:MAG: pyridoxal-phosphate dependent enzyme [Deltaproteobacteria bacterium]
MGNDATEEILSAFSGKIDTRRHDIWRYAAFYDEGVPPRYRLTLGEGWTRDLRLSVPRIGEVLLKREDLNPTGSHKARGLAYQVSLAAARGACGFVIPSSGNAAVAAAAYSRLCGLPCHAFLSPKTPVEKRKRIAAMGGEILLTDKPINHARHVARRTGFVNLRVSQTPSATQGYRSIALEIFEQHGATIDAVFLFVTSGTTLVGLFEGFAALRRAGEIATIPALYAVQCGRSTALAEAFGTAPPAGEEEGIAGVLGIERSPRLPEVIEAIARSGGGALHLRNAEILAADRLLRRFGIATSAEGCAALAGLLRCPGNPRRPLVLLTGHESQWDRPLEGISERRAESYLDLNAYFPPGG